MRARSAAFSVALVAISLVPALVDYPGGPYPPVHAQRGRGAAAANPTPPAPSVPHDPRDLSGVWARQRGVLTMSSEAPPMTAWGKAKFDAAKPVYGPRSVPGGLGNDPVMTCDPLGMPRNLFLEVSIYPMELVQTPRRVIQFFEWAHAWREIWTDGRALPKDPDPRWMGYAVGRWEGNEFVVNSLGFDERTWLDHFGNPISGEARFEERYRRVDRDTLELTMTLTDPKAYTKPWVSEKKTFRLDPKHEIEELFCVPSENDAFNKRVRDPGAGVAR
jgi:hypothetical protein